MFTIGVAIQTGTTYSLVQLVIGRYIAGLGVGSLSGTDLSLVVIAKLTVYFIAIVPLYNGETAPKAIRGTILVIYQVQIISGYALQFLISVKNQWRFR